MDGTSKTIIYKPVADEEPKEMPKYATEDEMKEIKSRLEDITDEIEVLSKKIKKKED